jgi:hypothetical protein
MFTSDTTALQSIFYSLFDYKKKITLLIFKRNSYRKFTLHFYKDLICMHFVKKKIVYIDSVIFFTRTSNQITIYRYLLRYVTNKY